MDIMKFVRWFRSEPHRAEYGVDHPAFKAAKEAWDYQQARIEALTELLEWQDFMEGAGEGWQVKREELLEAER